VDLRTVRYLFCMAGVATVLLTQGCRSVPQEVPYSPPPNPVMRLQPGDDVDISVFGVPDLNTSQKVRPDGKISVKLFGDVQAAGKSPMELQKDLVALYASQLQVKTITVIAKSSAVIYVTGAVVKPGTLPYVRPVTALEAIMESGGFDAKAGARRGKVRVIRTEGERVNNFTLDFDEVLTKGGGSPFYLRPFDTVYVPGSW
jgi:polysaccharide export outer membrane protein